MRILLCSKEADGIWFAWLLSHNGHKVDWTVSKSEYEDSLSGFLPPPLKRAPSPSAYDLVVFDSSGMGEIAEQAALLTRVIGGSTTADRLEHDRMFGLQAMEHVGIRVPAWEAFDSGDAAIKWLADNHKRTVLKPIGEGAPSNMTYVSKGEEDMVAFIREQLPGSKVKQFLLQEFVEGTEVSMEAWWTGSEFIAVNYTLEEKKLMAGGIGPALGCAGNVVWMPSSSTPLFEQGLSKISPLLADAPGCGPSGKFCGMIDLNCIVTEGTLYGLEWTPRFGYEGTCNLTRLLPMEFGEFLHAIASGQAPPISSSRSRFVATTRLSVPPYPTKPSSRKQEAHQPIKGFPEDMSAFFNFDVQRDESGACVVTGEGLIGCPIGSGDSIESAFGEVDATIKNLECPDMQYRNDLRACIERRYITLERQGWLRPRLGDV